ncbi:MAG: succinate dehydrogenase iron-sulfur subunit [Nitrospirae bacterium]|nr:MAG: succinate dehydrogenase iron-sulfur subunit [Nitrospirota bacterium]
MRNLIFRIRRFEPEKDSAPYWQSYHVQLEPTDRLLDGLIKIKDEQDGSLTFRRSCAHGICGSCAMKINGRNRLACQCIVKDLPDTVEIEPLEAYPVIKDLVVDMEPFFSKNEQVMPYLINNEPPPERERLQSPEEQERLVESITCIMCGSCTSACPVYWADREYLGPSALLKAFRFIFDTRDKATEERLKRIIHSHGLWRCHSIFNCVEVCPKEIDITSHIAALKRLALKKGFGSRKK